MKKLIIVLMVVFYSSIGYASCIGNNCRILDEYGSRTGYKVKNNNIYDRYGTKRGSIQKEYDPYEYGKKEGSSSTIRFKPLQEQLNDMMR